MSNVILDDRDPSVVYSSGWSQGGVASEYNGTTTYTYTEGATATVTFHGISIAVLGTLGANNTNQTAPQSQYQLDENKPVVYQPILTSGAQRNQKFYQSPEVLYDKHTLIVTNLINGSSLLIIDYFVVATANSTISASGQSTGTQNGTADPAVVGGSVGGVLGFIVLLALGIYIWRRRKSKTEFEFDSTVVQSAWVNPSLASHGRSPTPIHNRFNTVASSSSLPITTTTPLTSRKDLPPSEILSLPTSAPSTSHQLSSTGASDEPPPDYKP